MSDDYKEPDTGIPDDTPDEIMDFVRSNDVADKFTVMLKQQPEGGGKPQTLRSFSNYYPNVNTLGREWGPGSYILVFSWRGEGASGKKETVTRDYKIELPERAWGEEHERWLEQRHEKRIEEKTGKWREEALKAQVLNTVNPIQQQTPVSDIETLKKTLGILKDLGVPIGGQVKQEKEKEKKSFSEKLIEMAPVITALGAIITPLATAIITRPKAPNDNTLTNTLLTHVLNKPKEDDALKTVVPFLLGSLKQMMDFKESVEPQEKQSTVERIFDKIAPMVPAVLGAVAASREQAMNSPMAKVAQMHPDMRTLKADPELQAMMIQKLDEVYGFQQTNQIILVAGIERPESLSENYKKYPSQGFDNDGTASDGRTPPPDEVETETDEEIV